MQVEPQDNLPDKSSRKMRDKPVSFLFPLRIQTRVSTSSGSSKTPRRIWRIGVTPKWRAGFGQLAGHCLRSEEENEDGPDPPQIIPILRVLRLTPRQLATPLPSHSNDPRGPFNSISSPTSSSAKQLGIIRKGQVSIHSKVRASKSQCLTPTCVRRPGSRCWACRA